MSDYFFDKRKRKRAFIKYLIIFLVAFVPVVLFNIYVAKDLDNWLVIFLDVILLLAFVCVGNIIAKKIFERKDAKLEAKIKARDELNKQKQLILEQSYKAKSIRKKEMKKKKNSLTGEENETSSQKDN